MEIEEFPLFEIAQKVSKNAAQIQLITQIFLVDTAKLLLN